MTTCFYSADLPCKPSSLLYICAPYSAKGDRALCPAMPGFCLFILCPVFFLLCRHRVECDCSDAGFRYRQVGLFFGSPLHGMTLPDRSAKNGWQVVAASTLRGHPIPLHDIISFWGYCRIVLSGSCLRTDKVRSYEPCSLVSPPTVSLLLLVVLSLIFPLQS